MMLSTARGRLAIHSLATVSGRPLLTLGRSRKEHAPGQVLVAPS